MASGAWCHRTSSPMRPTSTTTRWDRELGAALSVSGAGAKGLVLGDHRRRRGTTWCLASPGNVVHQAKVSRLCEDSPTIKLILHFITFCVSITFRFDFNTIFTIRCDTKTYSKSNYRLTIFLISNLSFVEQKEILWKMKKNLKANLYRKYIVHSIR